MGTSSTSFSTGLIIGAVSFSLGVLYSNWAYDYFTLWQRPSLPEDFARSLAHYKQWSNLPPFLYHVHHGVAFIGLCGFFLKLYKPSESNTLFDGGALFLYMAGIIMYLTSIRIGIQSADSGEWGEIDEYTGINVIAATQIMITMTFLGVIGLQVGQYWAEVEDKRTFEKAMEEERQEYESAAAESKASEAAEAAETSKTQTKEKPKAKTTGSKTSKTSAKKK